MAVTNCAIALMNYECLPSLRFPPICCQTQVFFNWKNQLRTRAKKLKQIQDGKTGSDDKLALQKLTDVEKRALKLWKEDFQDKDIASVSTPCLKTASLPFPLHFRFDPHSVHREYFIDSKVRAAHKMHFDEAETQNKFQTAEICCAPLPICLKGDAPRYLGSLCFLL